MAWAGAGSAESEKIRIRAAWLNANVFTNRPIDDDAVAAMQGLGIARATELFTEVEGKANQLKNPGGYLKSVAKREGFVFGDAGGGFQGDPGSAEASRIVQRATWLSANVFPNRPIDDDAVAAMQGMGMARAMELFNELEAKAGQIKNPGGYLRNAAKREGFAPPEAAPAPAPWPAPPLAPPPVPPPAKGVPAWPPAKILPARPPAKVVLPRPKIVPARPPASLMQASGEHSGGCSLGPQGVAFCSAGGDLTRNPSRKSISRLISVARFSRHVSHQPGPT